MFRTLASGPTRLADGSLRVKTVFLLPQMLPPLVAFALVAAVEKFHVSRPVTSAGYLAALVAGLISTLFPAGKTYFFDAQRRELRVTGRMWAGRALKPWSMPFSDISKVWIAHDRPNQPHENSGVLILSSGTQHTLLFDVGGYWLTSSIVGDIEKTLQSQPLAQAALPA